MTRARAALRRLRRDERGYSLIELLCTMVILSVVLGALTNVFVTGSKAELDTNKRFQAQQNARGALDRIRTDLHCAGDPTGATAPVTIGTIAALGDKIQIYEPNCSSQSQNQGQSTITWCVIQKAGFTPARYTLYRQPGTSCAANTGTFVADFLNKNGGVFSYSAAPAGQLQRVTVDFPVQVASTGSQGIYELTDQIVLRNSARS